MWGTAHVTQSPVLLLLSEKLWDLSGGKPSFQSRMSRIADEKVTMKAVKSFMLVEWLILS